MYWYKKRHITNLDNKLCQVCTKVLVPPTDSINNPFRNIQHIHINRYTSTCELY